MELAAGSQDVAYEETILRDLGITHILNLVPDSPNLFENRIVYKNVPLLDDTSGKLRFYLGGCLDFIDSGRAVGAVLVHCNAGISRAPAVVIAYLMARTGVSLDNAIASVRSVRPVARPNPTFMQQLREYERELQHSPVQKQNGRAKKMSPLTQHLTMFVDKNQREWDQHLPILLMAYRSAEHESTGYSPARMLFGHEL
ncbi:DUSP19 [Cordylochernes scorpioides]|uniref:DUSP19 n=1 Tax=Cordylochernes scorpioides TaxID=51811 RepID=A0ABY6L2G8_9ARAC|nr:DUSP19 [Cordylochernes scorpioides]